MSITAAVDGRLAGTAVRRLVSRVERELVRRGVARRSLAQTLASLADSTPSASYTGTPVDEPPGGLTERDVLGCLADPETLAIAQHLVAAEIHGEGARRSVMWLGLALRDHFRRRFPGVDAAAANTYAELVFTRLHRRCKGLVGSLRATQKGDTDFLDWSDLTLARATVDSLDSYRSALTRPHRPTAGEREEWTERYRRAFALHEEISLPDLGNRRRIHYSEIFVRPRLSDGHAEAPVPFDAFLDSVDRTVLLGDPGAGKSTTSALSAAFLFRRGRAVPFYVVMREVDFTASGFSLVKVIEAQLSHRYQIEVAEGFVEELLLDGSALLLFDGLDEVQSESVRRRTSEIIETASRLYPLSRILATSRIVGYGSAKLDSSTFHEFRIRPFDDGEVLDDGEVRAYVSKWFAAGSRLPDPPDRVTDAFMRESASIPDLRCNPLLLAYICVLYRGHRFIPRSRAQLYRKCAELLLAEWDNFQGLPVDRETDLDAVRHTLAALAYRSITDPQWLAGMPEADVRLVAAAAMADESVPALDAARRLAGDLVDLCRGRAWIFTELGTETDGSGIFGFTHQSLQEYFAALHLTRNSGTPELLADHLLPELTGGRWEVLAQICMNLADDKWTAGSSRVVTRLLERGRTAEGRGLRTLVEFMARRLDVVRINVPTMRLLMQLAVESYLSTGSGDLSGFLSPSGPYPEAAWAAFEDVAREHLTSVPPDGRTVRGLSAAWLVVNASYLIRDPADRLRARRRTASLLGDPVVEKELGRIAKSCERASAAGWALSLYTGASGIRTLAAPEARRSAGPPDAAHSNVLSVMLDTAGTPHSLGPVSPAAWIFDVLGDTHTDLWRHDRAVGALEGLADVLGDPLDSLTHLDTPRLDNVFLDYWNTSGAVRCDRAFRMLYERGSDVGHVGASGALTGMTYLCAGLVEILDELFPGDFRCPLSVALLLRARTDPSADLEALTPRLLPRARPFVRRWAAGHTIWNPPAAYVS
ncbi:NACHT domain-containing protein [Streptomyces sp. NPDC013012]|uniref:NACHT domain-containing protein n=1 Tax=Streptomyces sp. NPDC013012 TaxID=3364860 RepID=UPI00369ADC06